mgnify:CR=1 FL=1
MVIRKERRNNQILLFFFYACAKKMNTQQADEELLREFACNGDLHQMKTLLNNKPNLNINTQNAMNGW